MSYVQNYFNKAIYFKNLSIKTFIKLFSINLRFNNLLRSVVFSFSFKTLVFNLNKYSHKYVLSFLLIFRKIKKIYNKHLNNQLLGLSLSKNSETTLCIKPTQQVSFFIFNKNYIFLYILFLSKRLMNYNSINLKQFLFTQNWNVFSLFLNSRDSNLIKFFILL